MPFSDLTFTVDGLPAHAMTGGSGYPLLLLHGSGPGASTLGNWSRVLDRLAGHFHVYGLDLIGFGKSARKPTAPYFDIDLWLRQCEALLAMIPGPRIGILAHSLSAMLALKLAARQPRIAHVLTTGAIGAPFRVGEALARAWTFPRTRGELRGVAESLVFDHALIDDDYLDIRMKILHGDPTYEGYFNAMFAGDKQSIIDNCLLKDDELSHVRCPVTMLHGRDDEVVPPAVTLAIAERLPQADVLLLAHCSHSVAMEHPTKLLAAARQLFQPKG